MKLLLLSIVAVLLMPANQARAQALLRTGDVFDLRLSGMPQEYANEFSFQYTVDDAGEASIPQLRAPIKAAGLSSTQLARGIEKRLVAQKIFTQPTALITTMVTSRFVTVGGGVRSPGAVPWSQDITISAVIKRAGG